MTSPGTIYKITRVVYVCWSFLGLGFLLLLIIIVAGFARDIEKRKTGI